MGLMSQNPLWPFDLGTLRVSGLWFPAESARIACVGNEMTGLFALNASWPTVRRKVIRLFLSRLLFLLNTMKKRLSIQLALSGDGMSEFAIKSATPLSMRFSRSLAPIQKQEHVHAFIFTVFSLEPMRCTMTSGRLLVTLDLYGLQKARISVRDTSSNMLLNRSVLTLSKLPIKISF